MTQTEAYTVVRWHSAVTRTFPRTAEGNAAAVEYLCTRKVHYAGDPIDVYRVGDLQDVSVSFEDHRRCEYCEEAVTSTSPDCTFCKSCYYAGTPMKPPADVVAALESFGATGVGIEHTGGGCFSLGGTYVRDGKTYAFLAGTDEMDPTLPPSPDCEWCVCVDLAEDDAWGTGTCEAGLTDASQIAAALDVAVDRYIRGDRDY